jgi:hypothetical protein
VRESDHFFLTCFGQCAQYVQLGQFEFQHTLYLPDGIPEQFYCDYTKKNTMPGILALPL